MTSTISKANNSDLNKLNIGTHRNASAGHQKVKYRFGDKGRHNSQYNKNIKPNVRSITASKLQKDLKHGVLTHYLSMSACAQYITHMVNWLTQQAFLKKIAQNMGSDTATGYTTD